MHGNSTVKASIWRCAHACSATHNSKWVSVSFISIENGSVWVVYIRVPRASLHSSRSPSLTTYCDWWQGLRAPCWCRFFSLLIFGLCLSLFSFNLCPFTLLFHSFLLFLVLNFRFFSLTLTFGGLSSSYKCSLLFLSGLFFFDFALLLDIDFLFVSLSSFGTSLFLLFGSLGLGLVLYLHLLLCLLTLFLAESRSSFGHCGFSTSFDFVPQIRYELWVCGCRAIQVTIKLSAAFQTTLDLRHH